MKKIFYVFVILLLLLYFLISDNHLVKNVINNLNNIITQTSNNDTNRYKFAIYLVKNSSPYDAARLNLDKLELDKEPYFTEKDISAYYWKSNIFKTDESVFKDRLWKINDLAGISFVLTANGERVYLGILWIPTSKFIVQEETTVLNLQGSASIIDNLNKGGYNVIPKSNEIYLEILAPYKGKDRRNDKRIYNALKDAGILKE